MRTENQLLQCAWDEREVKSRAKESVGKCFGGGKWGSVMSLVGGEGGDGDLVESECVGRSDLTSHWGVLMLWHGVWGKQNDDEENVFFFSFFGVVMIITSILFWFFIGIWEAKEIGNEKRSHSLTHHLKPFFSSNFGLPFSTRLIVRVKLYVATYLFKVR